MFVAHTVELVLRFEFWFCKFFPLATNLIGAINNDAPLKLAGAMKNKICPTISNYITNRIHRQRLSSSQVFCLT